MELLPSDSKTGLKCHQIILASVSKAIRSALKSALKSNNGDHPIFVTLPEFGYEAIKAFLDGVYDQLVHVEDYEDGFQVDPELEKSLELRILPGTKPWANEDITDLTIEHEVRKLNSLPRTMAGIFGSFSIILKSFFSIFESLSSILESLTSVLEDSQVIPENS